MRKTWLITTLVLILALLLAACGDGGAATGGSAAPADTAAGTAADAADAAGDAAAGAAGAAGDAAAAVGDAAGDAAAGIGAMLNGAFTAGTTNVEFGPDGAFTLGDDATGTYRWEGNDLVLSGGTLCPDQEGRYTVSGDATAGFTFTAVDDPCTARSDMLSGQGAFMAGG